MHGRRPRWAACGLVGGAWIALAGVGAVVYSPPAPRSADIPPNEFSAARARVILKDLVGDGIPHPALSKQNAVVRERILQYFREFGYDPAVQGFRRTGRGIRIAEPVVQNIVVRRRGQEPGRAIMLAAHYDSVARGPGASDDGVAVAAILEIARMLRELPPSRNDIILLITDAEEGGLVGARGFVEEHPWASEVGVAINLEARGTSGPSLMFETSEDSAWLISLFARHVSRPTTSSLYYEVYKRLPNDTDFTVFKEHGIEGYNFAFVRYVQNYHTKNDDFEHADPGSLQHHGQNAWQLLTALADFDLDQRTAGRAIYTDVLATFVVRWPASINLALAVALLAFTLATSVMARSRGLFMRFRWRILVAIALPLASGALLARFTGIGGAMRVDNAFPAILAYWCLEILVAFATCRYTPLGRADMWSAWSAVWVCWNAIGVAAAWFVPGTSFLFLLPGAVAALTGLLAALLPKLKSGRGLLAAACLGPIAAAVLWVPMQFLLYDGIGFLFPVYPVCAALVVLTVLPLFAEVPSLAQMPPIRPGA
jgi:hypothetical protein